MLIRIARPEGLEGAAQIGNARFYVYAGGSLTYESWKAGLDAGHTFVSSGPVVLLEVDGHLPGERVDVEPGATVRVTAHAYGHAEQVPLSSLHIIGHGRVLHEIEVSDPGQSPEHLSLDVELPAGEGLWLAARVEGDEMQYAHTTPVYVTVDGSGFHNAATVAHYLDRSEAYLRELEEVIATPTHDLEHHAWRYQDGLQQRIDETTGPYTIDNEGHYIPLSPRETEILEHVTYGMINKEIANKLGISQQTVKNHMTSILRKLNVKDRTQAAVTALRRGWVRIEDDEDEEL